MLVTFIPKAGKHSHIGPKNYRPVSLSSFFFDSIGWTIFQVRSLVSMSKHAYIKDKSIENTLHGVTGFIEANLARDEYTLSRFLDIEGAVCGAKCHTSEGIGLLETVLERLLQSSEHRIS